MKKLSEHELIELQEALSHLHVGELKKQLEDLQLSTKGFNKQELIKRLVHYAQTGKQLLPLTIPPMCKANRGTSYPLAEHTLMLHGAYKNDLQTRNFFKSIIGNHFHFTAQGIDWLREQWLTGRPPTYGQFIQEWNNEYARNQREKRLPKQEWAYIRFVQTYQKSNPQASKVEICNAWELQRQKYITLVHAVFKQAKQ